MTTRLDWSSERVVVTGGAATSACPEHWLVPFQELGIWNGCP
jgi:hypothetical protein